jgi:hypothetical protein
MVRYKVTPDRAAENEEGHGPLPHVNAFREFQRNIGERCDEAPVVSELRAVGAFHLFGDESEPTRAS